MTRSPALPEIPTTPQAGDNNLTRYPHFYVSETVRVLGWNMLAKITRINGLILWLTYEDGEQGCVAMSDVEKSYKVLNLTTPASLEQPAITITHQANANFAYCVEIKDANGYGVGYGDTPRMAYADARKDYQAYRNSAKHKPLQAAQIAEDGVQDLAASVEVYEAPVTQRPHASTLSAAIAQLQQNERLDIAAYVEADALSSHEAEETLSAPLPLSTPVTITTLGVQGVVVARSTCDGSRYQVSVFNRHFQRVDRYWVGRGVLEVEKKTPANEFASAS